MRTLFIPALFASDTLSTCHSAAANDHDAHFGHGATPAATAKGTLAEGVIKKIDKANVQVTLNHGPLPNGKPAMAMPFNVRDGVWLKNLREGQKIRFDIEDANGVQIITQIEFAKGQQAQSKNVRSNL